MLAVRFASKRVDWAFVNLMPPVHTIEHYRRPSRLFECGIGHDDEPLCKIFTPQCLVMKMGGLIEIDAQYVAATLQS